MGLRKTLPGWLISGLAAESPQLLHSYATMAAPPEAMKARSASALLPIAVFWPAGGTTDTRPGRRLPHCTYSLTCESARGAPKISQRTVDQEHVY